jgi:NAD-dependent dihydropyrimidine dehydrogenase PreA subunit
MMQVDLEKCTGCGECLDVCPVEAISLVAGKAAIDVDTCLSCGACIETCSQGAISDVWLPVPVKTAAVQPVKPQTAAPALTTGSESRLAWVRPLLSLVGREIVPRLADSFVAVLDRRLSASSENQVTFGPETVRQINGGRRQVRRRRRGRKF